MRADVSSEVRSSLAADAPPSRQGMPGGGTGGGSGAADAGAPAQGRGACSEGRQDCWQLMATVGRGLGALAAAEISRSVRGCCAVTRIEGKVFFSVRTTAGGPAGAGPAGSGAACGTDAGVTAGAQGHERT